MSPWKMPPRVAPDDELKTADELLDKADALLRRHKGSDLPPPDEFIALEDEDDIPVLTDVVDEAEVGTLTAAALPANAELDAVPASELAEQLISLDTAIARSVESWFATELPQLVARELDKLSDRLQEEALAHLRATLLPTLSEHISRSIEGGAKKRP